MRTTPAAIALIAAAALLTGCTSSSDQADAKPKPNPAVTITTTATPTGDGVSKACADAVYQLLIDSINGAEAPSARPDSCAGLTDTQWNQVIDEQSDKVFEAGKSAIEGSADDSFDEVQQHNQDGRDKLQKEIDEAEQQDAGQ